MDDLSQQLNAFLSDPNSMRQLQGMINNLGLGSSQGSSGNSPAPSAAEPAAPAAKPDLSALAGALGALGGGLGGGNGNSPASPAPNQDTLAMVTRLAPLLGRVNQEDDSTRLLRALRPLLSGERQKKIDEAVKILQLMRLLPLLQNMSGLF